MTNHIFIGEILVTPEMAAAWLEGNTVNRKIRQHRVNQYAQDMRDGNWKRTGEPIKFSADDRLLDGQHRLWAVIEAGVSVVMHVGYGFDDDVQLYMDTGIARTAGDALGMALPGNKNIRTALAATVKLGILDEAGLVCASNSSKVSTQVSHAQILEWLDVNPDAVRAVEVTQPLGKTCVKQSTRGYAYFRFARLDVYDAATFFHHLNTGSGLFDGDPILALRNRVTNMRINHTHVSQSQELFMMYRAWNAWRKGEKRASIQKPEGFDQLPRLV